MHFGVFQARYQHTRNRHYLAYLFLNSSAACLRAATSAALNWPDDYLCMSYDLFQLRDEFGVETFGNFKESTPLRVIRYHPRISFYSKSPVNSGDGIQQLVCNCKSSGGRKN